MKKFSLALLGLTASLFAGAALAQAPASQSMREDVGRFARVSPEARDKMSQERFADIREKVLEGHRGRIRILQEGESCIRQAQAPDQLRVCHDKERAALDDLRQHMHPQHEGMRKDMREFRPRHKNPGHGPGAERPFSGPADNR